MSINLKPLGDRVVIQPKKVDEKLHQKYLPSTASKDKPITGVVVAVGSGKTVDGQKVSLEVKLATT